MLGGAVLGTKDYIKNTLLPFTRHTGQGMSAFNAWVLLKSLETMSLRVERMSESALAIAEFLAQHPKVESVSYPFLPTDKNYELAKPLLTKALEVRRPSLEDVYLSLTGDEPE